MRHRILILLTSLGIGLGLLEPSASGVERTFELGGVRVALTDVTPEVAVFYQAMRYNRAAGLWQVEVYLTNKSGRLIEAPLVLLVDGYTNSTGPLQPDGLEEGGVGKAYYDFSTSVTNGGLQAGEKSGSRTISLGFSRGSPVLATRVYARGSTALLALAVTRSLNEVGQPLPGVTVVETGPHGIVTNRTEDAFGTITLGQEEGLHRWEFTANGHWPVWRQEMLRPGQIAVVPNPRLALRDTNAVVFTSDSGGQITNRSGDIRIAFGPGAFTVATTARLTPLTAQVLPAFLPLGWSPLQAFWLELSAEPSVAGTAVLVPWGPLGAGETAALARWNEATRQWDVVQVVTGAEASSLAVSMAGSGAYALVVGDTGLGAPPAPRPGQPLPGASLAKPDADALQASGKVEPPTRVASRLPELVTANAEVIVTNRSGLLASGLVLRCELTERYQFRDGRRRFPPQYENFVVGYQRPGDSDAATLHSTFPLRPLLLLGADELDEGFVHVDVLERGAFSGGVLSTNGGQIVQGPVRLLAGAGDLSGPQAVQLRLLEPTNFLDLVSGDFSIAQAFEVNVGGLVPGRKLVVQLTGIITNREFVLAKVLYDRGLYGLEPRERLRSNAGGSLTSDEPSSGVALPGLDGAGQYVLLKMGSPQGLVAGIAKNSSSQPAAGLPVRTSGQPWLTFSASNGSFKLLAPIGDATITVNDLATGDSGLQVVNIPNPQTPISIQLASESSGPHVVSISPTNRATSVPRVSPITVHFSEPVNPGTVVGNLQLLGTNGQPIAASLTLNLRHSVATLLPTDPLAAGTVHTISISTNITDVTGLKLESPITFSFTTESEPLNRTNVALILYEPTNGLAPLFGTPGAADPDSPVILVNETSGQTATVLSRVDGSFTNFIPADVDDFISAVLVNRNGTRTTLPASRQVFRDGSVALFNGGGILEAESDAGPVKVIVEPGSIPTKTKFKLDTFGTTELVELMQNTRPTNAALVGRGLQISVEGDDLTAPIDVSIPVTPAELVQAGLTNELAPEEALFALVTPATLQGDPVYVLVDKMEFDSGRLVTRSPPFPGADSLLRPADAVREALRLASLQLSIPRTPGADSAVRALAIAPLVLSERSQPGLFTGKVLESVANAEGTEVVALRPLAGALVTASAVGGFSGSRPGRLIPGSICCLSAANGHYSFMVAATSIGDPLNPGASGEAFMLSASHPSRLDQVVTVVNPAVSIGRFTDVIFPPRSRGPREDPNPPRVSVFHNPTFPAPGEEVQVVVLATHGSGQPAVGLTAVSASPASVDINNDVQISLQLREPIGAAAVRSTFRVVCRSNAVVVFNALAELGSAGLSSVPYAINFSGTGFPVQNPAPSDLHDISGPQVIYSVPRTDLGQSAPALRPADPIVIVFNEAVSRSVLENPAAVGLDPPAGDLVKELSADQRVLTVRAYALLPDTPYTLTLNSQISDIVSENNRLDQNPATQDPEPFILKFRTAPMPTGILSEIEHGGGAVLRGIYAYVLERAGSLDGAVVVYDLSNPLAPQEVAALSVPGFPRDLALIPNYAFTKAINPGAPVETKDLLAVVGGKVGGAVDEKGNFVGGFQYLWIIDIDDPDDPVRLASAVVSASPSSLVGKIQWSPPFLAYLESDADSQAVSLVNLQSFILSSHIAADEFSPTDNPGRDANGDGDFVDVDDELPVPSVTRFRFGGKIAAFGLEGNTQRILDFDWHSEDGFLGVTLSAGTLLDLTGEPLLDLTPGYLTLARRFVHPEFADAFWPITDGHPKRVHIAFGVSSVDASGKPRLADYALVSVVPNLGLPRLDVIEVSDPSEPRLVGSIEIPARHGIPQSIERRNDGLLMLATTEDLLLLDPSKLTEPPLQGSTVHPAFVGMIPVAGSGARTFAGDTFGMHVVSLGGKNLIRQTPPRIRYISFTAPVAPDLPHAFHPDAIRTDPEKVASALAKMQEINGLPPAHFRPHPECGIGSSLSPPQLDVHYYVLVEAPGSAGDTIELSLETLNQNGYPHRNKGSGFPPVRAMSSLALDQIGQRPRAGDALIRPLTAYRLSGTASDSEYNLYLSKPFALVCEPMTRSEVQGLQAELDREILWSGAHVRAYLDFSMGPQGGNISVLSPFTGLPDPVEKVMRAGTVAVADAFAADYSFGPNPPAVIGHASIPGTFGSVAAHNGEFRTDTVDLSLPSRRMGIVFKRTIAGQDLFDGPFGRGWDFNYNQRMVLLSPDVFPSDAQCALVACDDTRNGMTRDLLFYNGEGNVLAYKFAGTNPPTEFALDPLAQQLGWLSSNALSYFHSPTGAFDMVVQFQDQRFGRLLPDGTQFWYSPDGRLETIYHRYTKNYHQLYYNDRGELIRIQDHSVDTPRYLDIGYYRSETEQGSLSPADTTTPNAGAIGKIYRLVDYTGESPGSGRDVQFEYSEAGELLLRRGVKITVANQD